MADQINQLHAKTLIEVIAQSSHWKVHPEKKPPFRSREEAFKYVETHNEPLCVYVPVTNSDDHHTVRVTSVGDVMVFSNISFEKPSEIHVHSSHGQVIESSIAELINDRLPEGQKVVSL